jgi:DNA (cytosine-5)-methyltransferase 1
MRVLDLFAGIGGFSLAAHWMGWSTVAFVERDKFCQQVLTKNFPNVPIYGDIHDFDGTRFTADIISGGFPCQPFSVAGKRRSQDDDRYLWPEMYRVIREVRPTWVVCENVAGIIRLALDDVLFDLEAEGYTTETVVLPACAIGAQTRRDRLWIIGRLPDPSGVRCSQGHGVSQRQQFTTRRSPQRFVDPLYRDASRRYWRNQSSFSGVVDGLPNELDRLRAIGNSIVPQVAFEIFKAIEQA